MHGAKTLDPSETPTTKRRARVHVRVAGASEQKGYFEICLPHHSVFFSLVDVPLQISKCRIEFASLLVGMIFVIRLVAIDFENVLDFLV